MIIVPKFDFIRFLETIVSYPVTHLMWVRFTSFDCPMTSMRVSGSYPQWQFSWLSTQRRKIMIDPMFTFWLVVLHQSPLSFKNK